VLSPLGGTGELGNGVIRNCPWFLWFLWFPTEGGVTLLPASRMKNYTLPPQVLWRSPGNYLEWIMACKGCLPQTASNFNVAAPLTECVLLGVVALNFEGKLEYDAEKGIFTNNKEANKYLQPPHFRKGWSFT
jgi:hypothetical protein